jgi:hypothetical protein
LALYLPILALRQLVVFIALGYLAQAFGFNLGVDPEHKKSKGQVTYGY